MEAVGGAEPAQATLARNWSDLPLDVLAFLYIIPAGLRELAAHPRQKKFYRPYDFSQMASIDSPHLRLPFHLTRHPIRPSLLR